MSAINTRKRKDKWEYYFEIARNGTKRNRISKGGFATKSEVANVGCRIGSAIRSAKEEKERVAYIHDDNSTQKQGTPKSPHVRRSHFHSYWVGNGENKQLIVKWINTIFIKGDSKEQTTIHDIK